VIPVLTAAQMREADRRTIEEIGLPGAVLMENAGAAVARVIDEGWPGASPVVLCGKGNNGGDGFVVARRLLARRPRVLLFARRDDVRGDARVHLDALLRSGGSVETIADESAWQAARAGVLGAPLLVDALLGTGLSAAPAGLLGTVIGDLANVESGPPVVAVDLPSGLGSDAGACEGPVLRATVTVTFAAPKHGHVLPPACDLVGRLVVADIGIPRAVCESVAQPGLGLIEACDAASVFAPRAPGSHKGTYGHVLVLAGSVGKTGAAVLAAAAALRGGAGLVTVATPAPALPLVVARAPAEVMTAALPASPEGGFTREAVEPALALAAARSAVVLGPGIGTDAGAAEFVQAFAPRCPVPLVIDAGGVTGLAAAGPAGQAPLRERRAGTVLTPHPGEMGQLTGQRPGEIQRQRLETARAVAAAARAHVVLKGQRTLVADPDGRAAVNPTGNAGMATAGTGDVLSGLVGALLARGCTAWQAALAAVYVHGLGGDRAAARLGQESLTAGDLIEALPETLCALLAASPRA
jgi:NAD(P)H-hydrate epimerase